MTRFDPEVLSIGRRTGTRCWLVIYGSNTAMFASEEEARDFAQVVIARGMAGHTAQCPRCRGFGWIQP